VPDRLKDKYRETFEIDPIAALQPTAVRAKWIDQSQSHTVFMKGASGRRLSEVYLAAWRQGLKTTYYLRTLAASQVEKSTLDAGRFGFTQTREYEAPAPVASAAASSTLAPVAVADPALCRIDDPDCESCQ
jgi:ribonucleoside-diphosphate reductase alpha chain